MLPNVLIVYNSGMASDRGLIFAGMFGGVLRDRLTSSLKFPHHANCRTNELRLALCTIMIRSIWTKKLHGLDCDSENICLKGPRYTSDDFGSIL